MSRGPAHVRSADGRPLSSRRRRWLAYVFAVILGAGAGVAPAEGREVAFVDQPSIEADASEALFVTAEDVDGDGDVDTLAAIHASYADNAFVWYENDGSGASWTAHTIATGVAYAVSVLAEDIDGDGDLDALTASSEGPFGNRDDVIAWYENDGEGKTWTRHTISTNTVGVASVFAADVDGDTDLDVLSASRYDDKIAWYESENRGNSWTAQTISLTANGANSVLAADVDGDGDLDALSASVHDDKAVWYENDGTGASWTLHTIHAPSSNGPHLVRTADVDRDGDLDALSALGDGRILWYENDGTGHTWTLHTITEVLGTALDLFPADVDADGDIDVIYDGCVWSENGEAGSSWTDQLCPVGNSGNSIFAVDVDGDMDLDVLKAGSSYAVEWYRNETIHSSTAFASESVISAVADRVRSVLAADVDGDGDPDALSASVDDDKIAWYENDGTGALWTLHTITTAADGAVSVFAADVDGDGDLDALSASVYDDKIAWYENDGTGGTWTLHTITTAIDGGAWSVFGADVDGDGDVDALSAMGDETIAWHENDGSGSLWTLHTISATALGAVSVFAADIDGDGDADALSASYSDQKVAWYENDGTGSSWTLHTISTAMASADSVFAGDVDGDGDLDAVSASSAGDAVAWHENDGVGSSWALHTISASDDGALSVFPADVDRDGDLDVISGSLFSSTISWYENLGTGSTWELHALTTDPQYVFSVLAEDLDGDEDLDLLAGSSGDDTVAWYENRGGQFALATTDVAQNVVGNSQSHDLLAVRVIHRGRAGDTDVRLASLELLFTDASGKPLTTAEAQDLIQAIRVYLDDGSGAFESSSDVVVASEDLFLTEGVQTIPISDFDSRARVAHGAPKTFFVVAEMTSDAESQSPGTFVVEHLTEATSTAEDADHEIPLTLEHSANVATGTIDTALTSASCRAPFDLELAGRTVDTALICEAGTVLRAGSSFVVISPGDLTLRAGQRVELQDGFDVQGGGFTAEIDPGLEP